jgi:hypothetical protein
MVRTYQWTKGDKLGNVVKSIGETFVEDNIEYLVFNDGSMINTALLGEFLIEIPSESEAMLMQDIAPEPMKRTERPKQQAPVQVNVVQQVELSPLERLLLDSKKTKETFSIELDVDLPSVELMKVLAASYDDGEEQVLRFLAASIKFEEVKDTLASQIKTKAFAGESKPAKTTRSTNPRKK